METRGGRMNTDQQLQAILDKLEEIRFGLIEKPERIESMKTPLLYREESDSFVDKAPTAWGDE
jgi:hypothetical protein